MMKKYIKLAELDIIRLETSDLLTSSPAPDIDPSIEDNGGDAAPSRYNYRGMATDYEEQDW